MESKQQVWVAQPVVETSESGARELGLRYWQEVRRTTRGLVRVRISSSGVQIRVAGHGPAVLRFAPAQVSVDADAVTCVYAITGGLLSREPTGTITFSQRRLADRVLLESAIAGFHPTLAARPGAPDWTGELYKRVQARIHVGISGDYFRHLVETAQQ